MNIVEALKKDGISVSIKGTEFTFGVNGKTIQLEKTSIESLLYSTLLNQLKMLSENVKK